MLGVKAVNFLLFTAALGLPLTVIHLEPARGGSYGVATDCTPVAELVAFVAEETGYPPLRNCPRVRVVNGSVLRAIVPLKASAHGEVPLAAYLAANAEIFLSTDVVLTTPLGRSYLVHELVHAHQFGSDAQARAPCVGWLEGEAYRVQASYLKMRDFAEDAFAFELLGLMQGACAQSYHP